MRIIAGCATRIPNAIRQCVRLAEGARNHDARIALDQVDTASVRKVNIRFIYQQGTVQSVCEAGDFIWC